MSLTGEKCEQSGFYLSSGACGHATETSHIKGDLFPRCRVCGRSVSWTLLRTWGHPDKEPDIPA